MRKLGKDGRTLYELRIDCPSGYNFYVNNSFVSWVKDAVEADRFFDAFENDPLKYGV